MAETCDSHIDSPAWLAIQHDAFRLHSLCSRRLDRLIDHTGQIFDAALASTSSASSSMESPSHADRFLSAWLPLLSSALSRSRVIAFVTRVAPVPVNGQDEQSFSAAAAPKHIAALLIALGRDVAAAIDATTETPTTSSPPSPKRLCQLMGTIHAICTLCLYVPFSILSNGPSRYTFCH